MANAAPIDTGQSATLTLSSTALSFNWTSMSIGSEEIPEIDKTNLASTNYREFMPGDLKSPPEISVPFHWDAEAAQIAVGTVETVTVTWPQATGQTGPATYVGTGFIKSVKYPDFETDAIMEGELTIKLDGSGTEPTYTAATTV